MSGMEDFMLESGSGDLNDSVEDFTLSCAASNHESPPYSATLLMVLRVLQSLVWIIVISAGCFFNLFVIILVGKNKRLQVISFSLALQIAIHDLLLAFTQSFGLISLIANRWILGEQMCCLVGATTHTSIIVRILTMFVFITDRFLSVYPKYQTKTIVISSIVSWSLAVISGVAGYILDCYAYVNEAWTCHYKTTCNEYCPIHAAFFYSLQAVATFVPIILYIFLYIKAMKAKNSMNVAGDLNEPKTDWKATITFFLMFISLFVLVAPSVLTVIITGILYHGQTLPASIYVIRVVTVGLISLLTVSDPVFIMRNRDVREVIAEIFLHIKELKMH